MFADSQAAAMETDIDQKCQRCLHTTLKEGLDSCKSNTVECDGSRDDELTPEPGVTAEMYHFRWNASNFPTSEEPPGGKLFLEPRSLIN